MSLNLGIQNLDSGRHYSHAQIAWFKHWMIAVSTGCEVWSILTRRPFHARKIDVSS